MKLRLGLALLVLAGCSAADAVTESSEADEEAVSDLDPTWACPRFWKSADRTRKVVVTRPFVKDEKKKKVDVLDLSPSGDLTRTGVEFEMPKPSYEPIVFTPDGEIGIIAQDDGTLGVFRFNDAGMPEVIQEAVSGGFY